MNHIYKAMIQWNEIKDNPLDGVKKPPPNYKEKSTWSKEEHKEMFARKFTKIQLNVFQIFSRYNKPVVRIELTSSPYHGDVLPLNYTGMLEKSSLFRHWKQEVKNK